MPPDRVELPEDPLSAEQADSPVEDPGASTLHFSKEKGHSDLLTGECERTIQTQKRTFASFARHVAVATVIVTRSLLLWYSLCKGSQFDPRTCCPTKARGPRTFVLKPLSTSHHSHN